MSCDTCGFWARGCQVTYGNGEIIDNLFAAPKCQQLNGAETPADFHCNRYQEGAEQQVQQLIKGGAPWEHWVKGPCPDCNAAGSRNDTACHRCAGTSQVRYYDDGYVGEEQRRVHPMEEKLAKQQKAAELRAQAEALLAEAG